MTLPRSPAQDDLHALLCKRHTKDQYLHGIVRSLIKQRISAMRMLRSQRPFGMYVQHIGGAR